MKITKPKWLEAKQHEIANVAKQPKLSLKDFKASSCFNILKSKWKKTGDDEWFDKLAVLPKHLERDTFAVFPCTGDLATIQTNFGSFISLQEKKWQIFKYNLMEKFKKKLPDYADKLSRMMCCKPFVGYPMDTPTVTTLNIRKSLHLTPASEELRKNFTMFLDCIFDDIKYDFSDGLYCKKAGSPGVSGLIGAEEPISYRQLYNKTDEFGVFKSQALNYFMQHIDDIVNLLIDGDFEELLNKHNVLFASRLLYRMQEDDLGKKREVVPVWELRSYLEKNKEVIRELVNYKISLEQHWSLWNELPDWLQLLIIAARLRNAYGAELFAVLLANILLPFWRKHMKDKYPKVFKFGSDTYLESIITEACKKIADPIVLTLDVTQFDHSIDYTLLVTLHDYIWSKDSVLGLFLSVQCISPIMIGSLGFNVKTGRRERNLMLGDPLDSHSFFFGQGKSGDADVADRCKLMCAFLMAEMIRHMENLPANKETYNSILSHETKTVFLNLGDNNLIITEAANKKTISDFLSTNTILRAELDNNPIFGGKEFTVDKSGKCIIKRSPISFIIKLLCSEYSYDSDNHIGWSEGFLQRWDDASEEYERTGDNRLLKILEDIDEELVKTLGSMTTKEMALLYNEPFKTYVKETDSIYQMLNGNIDNDFRVRELMLDIEKIRWKWDIEEFEPEIQQILRNTLFNKVESQTLNIIKIMEDNYNENSLCR